VQDCSISSAASAEAYVLKFGWVRYDAFYGSVEMTSSTTRGKWQLRRYHGTRGKQTNSVQQIKKEREAQIIILCTLCIICMYNICYVAYDDIYNKS